MKQGKETKVIAWLANLPADRASERQRLADLFGVLPNEVRVEPLEDLKQGKEH